MDLNRVDGPLRGGTKPQQDVGGLERQARAVDADGLDRIRRLAETGRVDKEERDPTNGRRHFDHVARRAGQGRDYGRVPRHQRIEQAGFSGIRRPGDNHPDPVLQPLRRRARQPVRKLLPKRPETLVEIGGERTDIVLVGKVERRLDLRGQSKQALLPALDLPAKRSPRKPHGRAALRLCFRLEQIGEALGLGQVDSPMFERAPSELSRDSLPQAGNLLQRGQHARHDRSSAVEMELGDIFAGCARWAGKTNNQRLIKNFAIVPERRQPRPARLRKRPRQIGERCIRARPADAHNRHRGGRRARGQGVDGIRAGSAIAQRSPFAPAWPSICRHIAMPASFIGPHAFIISAMPSAAAPSTRAAFIRSI